MIKRTFQLLLFLFLATNLFSQQLPLDERVRTGVLPNGLTYFIRHNALPEQRVDFFLVHKVGSILEEEHQRGLAHFLEHMAFNGTKNFPGLSLREYLQANGIRFGENLNAYVSIDETVYMIRNVPTTRSELLDSCLLILHDWSGFILLEYEEIENERGVIREEWRTRNNANSRMVETVLPEIFGDDRYGHRLPIGTIDVINNFVAQDLRDFYEMWYRPDLQAVIIVGDIDVDDMEERVIRLFSTIPAAENPVERVFFPVTDNIEPIISIATDPEATRTSIWMFNKYPAFPFDERNTVEYLTARFKRNMASMMINARFNEIVQDLDSPFMSAGASAGNFFVARTKDAWTSVAHSKEGMQKESLSRIVEETRRVLLHGFTASEYDRARANFLRSIESAYLDRENQQNDTFVRQYIRLFLEGEPAPGIEFKRTFYNELVPNISVEAINEHFFQTVSFEENVVIVLMMPEREDLPVPTREELLAVFENAKEMPVTPYEDRIIDSELIAKLPSAGEVSYKSEGIFGTTEWILSNGIRVIFKQTDFKEDQILMRAVSSGGTSLIDEKHMPTIHLLNDLINLGGVGNFSRTDLSRVLAGKRVSVSPLIGLRTEAIVGSCSPADFETMMRLVHLYMTNPRTDNNAFEAYLSRQRAALQNLEVNPRVTFIDSVNMTIYGNHPRAQRMSLEMLDYVDYELAMQIYRERFMNSDAFTFMFVGNINPDSVRQYIEKYLASLPNTTEIETFTDVSLRPREGKHSNVFERAMEIDQASVLVFYSGKSDYTLQNNIYMDALIQILQIIYTDRIREEEGGTYGVRVSGGLQKHPFPKYRVQISFNTDPDLVANLLPIVYQEIENLVENGPAEATFNKVKEFMLKRIVERKAENSFWMGAIDEFVLTSLDVVTEYVNILNEMQPSDIHNFAKQIFEQENRVEVVMKPKR